jgi:hypothetical protein
MRITQHQTRHHAQGHLLKGSLESRFTEKGNLALSATPLQFNTSMLLDLLNAQERNSQSGTSMAISNEEVPGGLQLKGINASDAANEVIRAIGWNGELTLSEVDKFLGITTPESGAHSPEAVIARDWNKLTSGSDGQLSASQLTTAITNLSDSPATTPAFRPSWGFAISSRNGRVSLNALFDLVERHRNTGPK